MLRPLQREDAPALLGAAADGQLWNLTFMVVQHAGTIGRYIDTTLAGRANRHRSCRS